ncbi:MAG TPA: SH3 domain-containing protein [Sideroxyarcus sp.]|nr:SH3 domain-containing protein [Sideroxyarcus sp.]
MKKQTWIFAMLSAAMLYAGGLYAEQVYYVQSAKAKVLAEPSFRSKVVLEVVMGQALNSLGKQGSWMKISSGGKEGYVSSLLLSTRQPLNRKVVIQGDDTEIKMGVRRRASSFASAAAARGLTRDDRRRIETEEGINFTALKEVEAFTVTDEEVNRFINGGAL